MEKTKSVYVVMRRSGAIMRVNNGLGSPGTDSAGPYLSILSTIANEMGSAGGNWDAPEKLFFNGACVVEKGLADIAWRYQEDSNAARWAAAETVAALYNPDWVPDDEKKAAYRQPGQSLWKIEKVEA